MLVPHLLKIYFGLGSPSSVLEIVSSQRSAFKIVFHGLFKDFGKFTVADNHIFKEVDGINSVQSSEVCVLSG